MGGSFLVYSSFCVFYFIYLFSFFSFLFFSFFFGGGGGRGLTEDAGTPPPILGTCSDIIKALNDLWV